MNPVTRQLIIFFSQIIAAGENRIEITDFILLEPIPAQLKSFYPYFNHFFSPGVS
jgi:hypothetical protein